MHVAKILSSNIKTYRDGTRLKMSFSLPYTESYADTHVRSCYTHTHARTHALVTLSFCAYIRARYVCTASYERMGNEWCVISSTEI